MAKNSSEFGKYVSEKRIKKKLSYQNIADAVGVSRPYIYDIEKGNNKPPTDYQMLDEWAKVLELKRKSREVLFDKAAIGRTEIPADVMAQIAGNKKIIEVIRQFKYGNLNENFWDKAIAESKNNHMEEDDDE